MKLLYTILMLGTLSFPLIKSFDPRVKYASKWGALFPAVFITALIFIAWDVQFTELGVWGFNRTYTLDLYLFGLPLEEWLFFILVPFACVFIYEVILYYFPSLPRARFYRILSTVGGILLITLALLFRDQLYTFWCFLLTGIFMLYLAVKNPIWVPHFYVAYAFHLLPFLLINGILTGALTAEPVVWYNDAENFGIRMYTIPVEDAFYSMLLLGMNITFYEYFKSIFFTKPSWINEV